MMARGSKKKNKSLPPSFSKTTNTASHMPSADKTDTWWQTGSNMEAEEVGSEGWETGPRLCATFCRVGSKTASFAALPRLIVERVLGNALGGIPRLFTWKALSLSFWNREINKCPSECIRIKRRKKQTPKLLTQRWMTAHVWAGACAPHRHRRDKMRNVISTQPPVYVKGVNKHHMNSSKAHPQSTHTPSLWDYSSVPCNLNPLFESSACVRVCMCVRREDSA